jgi:hypothetical protein
MTVYPFGYAGTPQGMGTLLTIEQYEQLTTIRNLNFEFWRRVKAMMQAAASVGVYLGVGGGWRIQPVNGGPGFASPGNSNHEGFPADDVSGGAVAADMVPSTSWLWMEANVARFGLRTFRNVNNEPWHIQPAEIPASRSYRKIPWVLATFPLPGDSPPYNPFFHQYGDFPTRTKPRLSWLAGYAPPETAPLLRPYASYFNHVMRFECGQPIRLPYEVFTGEEPDDPRTPTPDGGSIWAERNVRNFFDPKNLNTDQASLGRRAEAYFGVVDTWMWQLVDAIATNFGRPR